MQNKFKKLLTATILTLNILSLNIANAATGSITQVNFTTSAQSIAVSNISDKITIQTQNAGSTNENLDETSDLVLKSSSQTGEFSSSNTSWNNASTITMSKGSANRSFYYKDSTAGTHTITAEVKTRTSLKSWATTQNITIGSGISSGSGTPSSEASGVGGNTTSSSTNNQAESTNTESSEISSHASGAPLSSEDVAYEMQVSLGRARVGVAGVPLEFNAKIAKSKNVYSLGQVNWSFGDGTSGVGERVSHTYFLSGEYVVILNASSNGVEAVDRGVVKIFEPKLSFGLVNREQIEIKNLDNREINLGEWKINHNNKSHTIPKDTIILAGKSLKLSQKYLALDFDISKVLELNNPNNYNVLNYYFKATSSVGLFENKVNNLEKIQEKIDDKIIKVRQERVRARLLKLEQDDAKNEEILSRTEDKDEIDKVETIKPESAIIRFEERKGFWSKLLNLK